MILRIAGEGQFEVDDAREGELNELDSEAVRAVEAGDEAGFARAWQRLLEAVESGRRLGDDELAVSDVILPPRDISLDEARGEFTGHGLIPD